MRDFTLNQYHELLNAINRHGIPIFGVLEWVRTKPDRGVLVRHDVDRKPRNALAMAQLEARMGIHSTYYFRIVGSAYDTEIIKAVSDLGHEVGYHYEDLALANGDLQKAHGMFAEHLAQLRLISTISTIAMHGSPLSRFNNLDLWRNQSLGQYGLIADAFLDVDYAGVPYFTDTGRSWAAGSANLRDKPQSAGDSPPAIHSTLDLIAYLEASKTAQLAISAHPERWACSASDWWLQLAKDRAVNGIKRVLRAIR